MKNREKRVNYMLLSFCCWLLGYISQQKWVRGNERANRTSGRGGRRGWREGVGGREERLETCSERERETEIARSCNESMNIIIRQ